MKTKIKNIGIYLVILCLLLGGCGKKTPQEKIYHIGILSGLDFFASAADGFKARMKELGYVEGKNVIYDLQKTNLEPAAEKRILGKFIADKVDLIFVFPTEASVEAKEAAQGTGIPVVFAIANIEGVDLVKSVREPGGNITGVRWPGPDLAAKRFEIMHELVPQAKRMWLPYQKSYPIVASQLEILRPMAASAGITLLEVPANNATELEAQLQERAKSVGVNDTDAILLMVEPFAVSPDTFAVLGKFADEHKIPVGGALMLVGGYESIFGLTPQNIPVGRHGQQIKW